MLVKNTPEHFGVVTKLLHWTIALLIFFLIWLGWYMVDLTYFDKWYNESLSWHKALGMIVLGLACIKIAWQFYTPVPDTLRNLKPWERNAATIMHLALLAIMVLIPVTGYFISTSAGKAVDVFGWFRVPALFEVSKEMRDLAIDLHFYLAYATAVLALGHIGAALKHEFIDKDGTLRKML